MNFKTSTLIWVALFSLIGNSIQAQQWPWQGRVAEIRLDPVHETPLHLRFYPETALTPDEFFGFMHASLKLKEGEELVLVHSEEDMLGYQHLKFQIHHAGYPVEGAFYKAHTLDGKVLGINGNHYPISQSPQIVISELQARQLATSHIGATTYKWEIPGEEAWLQRLDHNPSATYFPKGELVYMTNALGTTAEGFRLAYRFDVYAHAPMSRQDVYIDAQNGEVVFVHEKIHTIDANGMGWTRYLGIQSIVANDNGVDFDLTETGRASGVETYNMVNTQSYNNAVGFTDDDNFWDTLDIAQVVGGTDAHWGAEMTFDYFSNIHGRNSYDGNGAALISFVNYGNGYSNAFWNGQVMTYGAGASNTRPFSTLDVCGHEFTHGLTGNTSGLIYAYESGALNESFSDIFGVAIEFFASPTPNWAIGEDIGAFRSLSNPSIFQDPDTYLGSFWVTGSQDNGGVHTNSGVQNHWFYLLTVGGSGTNDNGDSYAVTGIGMQAAAAIAFRNNTVYLNPNSGYEDARYYAIQSAIDLYGECSPEMIQTFNAWHAVGVGQPYTGNLLADYVTYDTLSCTAPFQVEFLNLSQSGISYFWDFGDGSTSTDVSPTHTYSSTGVFDVRLIAYGCSTTVDSTVHFAQIEVNTDLTCNINLPAADSTYLSSCTGNLYDSGGGLNYLDNNQGTVVIEPSGGSGVQLSFQTFNYAAGDYIAIYDGPSALSPLIGYFNGTTSPGVITSSGTALTLVENTNGFNNREGFFATWSCAVANSPEVDTRTFDVWPNPSSGRVNISYKADAIDNLNIRVLNANGQIVRELDFEDESQLNFTLDLENLSNGIYFIQLMGREFSETTKFLLQ